MILYILYMLAKDACLPGSTMCLDNMLKICDINGYWITTDCPKNTECTFKKGIMACVSVASNNEAKENKIIAQLVKLTKDKDFVRRLKKELTNEDSDEDETEGTKENNKNYKKRGGVIGKRKSDQTHSKNNAINDDKSKIEDQDSRSKKQNNKRDGVPEKLQDDNDNFENSKPNKKNYITVRRVNHKDDKAIKTITYYPEESKNTSVSTVTVTKTIEHHHHEGPDIEFEVEKRDKDLSARISSSKIIQQMGGKNGSSNTNIPDSGINKARVVGMQTGGGKGKNSKKSSGLLDTSNDQMSDNSMMSDKEQDGNSISQGQESASSGTQNNGISAGGNESSNGANSQDNSGGQNASNSGSGGASQDNGSGSGSGGSSQNQGSGNSAQDSNSQSAGSNGDSQSNTKSDGNDLKSSKASSDSGSSEASNSSLSDSKSSSSQSGSSGGGGKLTAELLTKAMQKANYKPKPEYIKAFVNVANSEIKDINMIAMFAAQCAHESGGFQYIEEIACAGSTKCASQYGGGQGKPGKSYHGRGFIQLSWPANYKEAGKAINMDLFSNPEKVAQDPTVGAKVSAWFWKTKVETAAGVKQNHFGATTKAINGALECTGSNVDKSKNRYRIYKILVEELKIGKPADESGCY